MFTLQSLKKPERDNERSENSSVRKRPLHSQC